MGVIAATSMAGKGVRTLTETTLTASDTFSYQAGDELLLRNPTGGALSPTITGSAATTWPVDGILDPTISSGLAVGSIPAGQARVIPLDTVRGYLQGTITITAGTGLIGAILRKN